MMQQRPMSQIEYGRKFNNFWSSVSAVKIEDSVSEDTLIALIAGVTSVEIPPRVVGK